MDTLLDEAIALRIPESMKAEHEELHTELYEATQASGMVGEAARYVADVLHEHFEKEEAFALPPLGLLTGLAQGDMRRELRQVLPLTERLKRDLPQMLAEHRTIVAALDQLAKAAKEAQLPQYVRFAEKLKLHAETEEQLSYPTAILIGEYIKLLFEKYGLDVYTAVTGEAVHGEGQPPTGHEHGAATE